MEILRYKEYKIANAIWIQQQDEKRTNWGTNTEQFSLECYIKYLMICDVNKQYIDKCYQTIFKIGNGKEFDKGERIERMCRILYKYLDLCYDKFI